MSHPDNQSPRYGGVTLPKFRGQVTTRFADDLKPADHPGLCAFIGIERLAGALIPLDTGNGIKDIQQARAIASHAESQLDRYGFAQDVITDSRS